MPTLGHTLAAERLRQKLELEQVATITRISTRLLTAIEADDFRQLPGRVFARNFVRQYAEVLKLDTDKVLAQFDREQSPKETVVESKPAPESFSPRFSLNLPALADVFGSNTLTSFLSFILTIGVGAFGVWTFNNWGALRARVLPKPVVAAAKAAPRKVPAAARPVVVAAAKPKAVDAPAGTVHVLLAASGPCWTRITVDGKVLFTGTLNPGETREVNAATVVDLRAGNAGALAVKLNGSDIPALGPKGQTRTVILTSSGAHVRTPIPDPVSEPL